MSFRTAPFGDGLIWRTSRITQGNQRLSVYLSIYLLTFKFSIQYIEISLLTRKLFPFLKPKQRRNLEREIEEGEEGE